MAHSRPFKEDREDTTASHANELYRQSVGSSPVCWNSDTVSTFAFTSPHDAENGKLFRPRQGSRVRPYRVGIKTFHCAALAFLWWPNYTNWLKNRQQLVHPVMRIDVEHRRDALARGESPAGALQESRQLRILPAGCPLTRGVIIELLQVFSDLSTDDTEAGTSSLLAGLWPETV